MRAVIVGVAFGFHTFFPADRPAAQKSVNGAPQPLPGASFAERLAEPAPGQLPTHWALALGALVCSGAAAIRPRAALAVEEDSFLDDAALDAEKGLKVEKAINAMTKFSNTYAKKTDTFFSQDPEITYSVIRGLAEHKVELGVPLCPCRFYEDKKEAVKEGYWNCPCVPMRECGDCHCMLFLAQDDPFVGTTRDAEPEDVMKFAGDVMP